LVWAGVVGVAGFGLEGDGIAELAWVRAFAMEFLGCELAEGLVGGGHGGGYVGVDGVAVEEGLL